MKNFDIGFLNIYGIAKDPAIDLYLFGFRFRWYPKSRYFGIRKMERLLRG